MYTIRLPKLRETVFLERKWLKIQISFVISNIIMALDDLVHVLLATGGNEININV
jgi:hypothetical protein